MIAQSNLPYGKQSSVLCQLAMENAFPACQSCCMAKSAKKISYRFWTCASRQTLRRSSYRRASKSRFRSYLALRAATESRALLMNVTDRRPAGVPWQEFIDAGATGWMSVPLISFCQRRPAHLGAGAEVLADSEYVQAANLESGDWIALRVKGHLHWIVFRRRIRLSLLIDAISALSSTPAM